MTGVVMNGKLAMWGLGHVFAQHLGEDSSSFARWVTAYSFHPYGESLLQL